MKDDEALLYHFTPEVRTNKVVSDATFEKTLAKFGERGIIDIMTVAGYYDIVCMTLNVAQVPVPKDSKVPQLAKID